MGIRANWIGIDPLQNAYIKIVRIWGSKEEGWNASVGVFKTDKDVIPSQLFHIHVAYVEDKNPFDILYAKLGRLSFLNSVRHDVSTELNAVTADHIKDGVTDKLSKKKKSK